MGTASAVTALTAMPRNKLIEEPIEFRRRQFGSAPTSATLGFFRSSAKSRFHLASQCQPQGFEDCGPLPGNWIRWITNHFPGDMVAAGIPFLQQVGNARFPAQLSTQIFAFNAPTPPRCNCCTTLRASASFLFRCPSPTPCRHDQSMFAYSPHAFPLLPYGILLPLSSRHFPFSDSSLSKTSQ